MKAGSLPVVVGLVVAFFGAIGCRQRVAHSAVEVEAAMGHYDSLIKKTDADSIAWMFTADGQLGDIAHGRDSIRRFLRTFKNVRVLQESTTTDHLVISGDKADQKGLFVQIAVVNGKDTVHIKGSYETEWVWSEEEGWKIRRETTRSEDQPDKP